MKGKPDIQTGLTQRERADVLYHVLLGALDGCGDYPRFRAEVIEECGKAFERFLEKYCNPKATEVQP